MPGRTEVRPEKIKEVNDIVALLKKYQAVGILNMTKVPANALQKMKHELNGKAVIKFSKRNLLILALEKTEDKKSLVSVLGKQPALLLSDMNPFKLYKFLDQNKTNAPAKAGEIAPDDIEVKAGPTDLMPGPAISTLSGAGIPAKVEAGKISVIRDKVICKKGDVVTPALASVFQMLKLKPMKVGLDLSAVFEHGILFNKSVLAVDEKQIIENMSRAFNNAINLSYHIKFPTKDTIKMMLTKGFIEARALAMDRNIVNAEVIEDILAKAKAQADALKAKTGE